MNDQNRKWVVKATGVASIIFGFLLVATTASAQKRVTYDEYLKKLIETNVSTWLSNSVVIDSIKVQNKKHEGLSQDEIIKLDKKWRAERKSKSKPMIKSVLSNKLSDFLKSVKSKNDGMFSEIFVMDNKGLNVGQSDVTSDYWQGDEAKWKNTFLAGPGSIEVSDREYDDSSNKFLIQVSVPVLDPSTKAPIGAATIGVSLVKLIRAGVVASHSR